MTCGSASYVWEMETASWLISFLLSTIGIKVLASIYGTDAVIGWGCAIVGSVLLFCVIYRIRTGRWFDFPE